MAGDQAWPGQLRHPPRNLLPKIRQKVAIDLSFGPFLLSIEPEANDFHWQLFQLNYLQDAQSLQLFVLRNQLFACQNNENIIY